MHSVTSEAQLSVSFQTAPPKPARPDLSQGNDSFGSLVDSSTPVDTGNDRAASAAQQQAASNRRADDDASANADSTRLRNTAAADRAARNASDDRDANAQQASDADAHSDANPAAAPRSRTKSDAPKTGAAKSTAKSSSDTASKASASDSSTAPAGPTPQNGAPVATPDPVAVALAVIVPVTDSPAATPTSGNATAPLAIAAAAIAASSAAGAPVAAAAQIKTDSDAAATTSTAAASSDTAAAAKIAVGVAANAAIGKPVNQQVPATGIGEVTQAIAPATEVAPKTTLPKAAGAAQGKTVAAGDLVKAPGTSDRSAAAPNDDAVAQQPGVAGKPDAGNAVVDPAKANASADASPASAASVTAHEHSAVATTAHAPTDALDTGAQPTGTFQSQLPAAVTTAAPAGPLSVTAASNAPVPLSGLAVEIAASVRSGKSHFEIRLDPADLGRIDVRIDVDRNGQVTSHLTVEKPETLSMLRQDAPQLQQALDDAGFKTGGGGLQFSLRDQSSSGQNSGNDSGRNAQRLIVSDDDTIPATVAGRSYGRMLGSSSGVDIRV